MIRVAERNPQRVVIELGLKTFRQLDDAYVKAQCRTVFANWRRLVETADEVSVLMWIGDGDEVFNWKGDVSESFKWNDVVGFCNLKYDAYPESPHYRNGAARKYVEKPPAVTYADLKTIIQTLRETAREMYGKEITVGDTIDAGPEFVESEFKFERHPELLKGGPKSEFPKSLAFLCCYAQMKGDSHRYAGFPSGIPDGTLFGTFLGRQFESMAAAVGFDYVWLSNGFGLTHYAWNYLGEVFDGLTLRPERAPESIRNFVSFWKAFRAECPSRPIEIRGTNYSIGMDATSHGIDIREIYKVGGLRNPSPNPPWGSSNLGLEMAAHLSRISSTPHRTFPFRYYINDSWFPVVPWYDYYNREPFDIYCPMSASRITAAGKIETPTDMIVMTANTGYGELLPTQASEIEPHLRRAFNVAPDEAGPLVWAYPFDEYQDELQHADAEIQKSFFGDWFIARAIAAGLPLNTVITTKHFAELQASNARAFARTFAGRVLIVPTPGPRWKYLDAMLAFVKSGGNVLFYGSLHDAPKALLDALNVQLDAELEGDFDVALKMEGDVFDLPPRKLPLRHKASQCDGGIAEILKDKTDKRTAVRATVSQGSKRRVYALVREGTGKAGRIGWIRGSLPFEAKPDTLEPVLFRPEEVTDSAPLVRYLLTDFGFDLRQHRHSIVSRPNFVFVSRSRGSYFFNGHGPDATVSLSLSFPEGAPVLCERQALVKDSAAAYHLDRSSHFECQAFVRQEKESVVSHKEVAVTVDKMRSFTIGGLVDAVLTLHVPSEAIEKGLLKVRKIIPYVVQDPTAKVEVKKGEKERDLKWKVDPKSGGVVVERVSGSVKVTY